MNKKAKSIIASIVAVSSLLAVSSILINQKSAPAPATLNKTSPDPDPDQIGLVSSSEPASF
ncbi:hypothetical protein [Paenibacillus shenyangensis]|uniref:hypothetical protein n=1 Tax=Paenibacillus sp. A9 TaxID=1284352 RepID=UPI000A6E7FF3|nr:hypothetical protein [Paenibacillus sp. A9]